MELRRPLRVFKTRAFGQFARKEGLSDVALCEAIDRAERGLVDADLGGHVIKQRVARPGQGRSGGYRTLIAFRKRDRAIFIFGFAKNDRDNVSSGDLKRLREAAAEALTWRDAEVAMLVASGKWIEVNCDAQSL